MVFDQFFEDKENCYPSNAILSWVRVITKTMVAYACNLSGFYFTNRITTYQIFRKCSRQKPINFSVSKPNFQTALAISNLEEVEKPEIEKEKSKFRWVEVGSQISEDQKEAISQLPPKMSKRCKAVMKQIICYSPQKGSFPDLLAVWVKVMKPERNHWLSVLKELKRSNHPLYLEMAKLALNEDSFEANVRDYTKIIHFHGKQNQPQEAENTLLAIKDRGFACDQVTLTAMIDVYSKAGNLKMAEETFQEIKRLGHPLDKRSYGTMIMAYVRAEKLDHGEIILKEMDENEVYAGSEVYKALLRAYSMIGDAGGAQRVFDAIQLAGILPDARLCGLLINAYRKAGENEKAHIVFENMRRAGLEPNDKCVALMLAGCEQENRLNMALEFLMDLERSGVMIGKESSEVLAGWFRKLGVVEEVELVLREYVSK